MPAARRRAAGVSKDKLHLHDPAPKGIRFNDGTPFNAQAVVTTIQRDMTLPASSRASDFSSVDSVTASGPYTVVIHLKHAVHAADSQSSPATAGMIMSPTQLAKLGDDFGRNPVCVGPFMFDNRVAGDNVTVIKSPYYYDQKNVHLDKIVFKVEDRRGRRGGGAEGGRHPGARLGLADRAAGRQADTRACASSSRRSSAARRSRSTSATRTASATCRYANVGTPLASSPKLRQAFEEAIDRKATGKVVFGGRDASRAARRSRPRAAWFDATHPLHALRPARTRRSSCARVGLLEPDRAPADANSTDEVRLAQFIQAQEAAVGINVVIDSVDALTRTVALRAGKYEARVGPNWTVAAIRTNACTSSSTPRAEELKRLLESAARRAPRQGAAGADEQGGEGPLPRGHEDHPQRAADPLPGPRDQVRRREQPRDRRPVLPRRHSARRVRAVQVGRTTAGFGCSRLGRCGTTSVRAR